MRLIWKREVREREGGGRGRNSAKDRMQHKGLVHENIMICMCVSVHAPIKDTLYESQKIQKKSLYNGQVFLPQTTAFLYFQCIYNL